MLSKEFFDTVRPLFAHSAIAPFQVSGMEAIDTALAGWKTSWRAYGFATAFHETAQAMVPMRERGGSNYFSKYGMEPLKSRLGNRNMADGLNFYGRGYVQITGYRNYHHFGLDLLPDKALMPDIAGKIMREGMETGFFTGKKLADYFPTEIGTHAEAVQARRIINGQDCAEKIATYFDSFQKGLIIHASVSNGSAGIRI